MKTISIWSIVLLLSAGAWSADVPNPAEYTVNVHVVASRVTTEYGSRINSIFQVLNVVIDGQKYELKCQTSNGLLALGDYKARLVTDEHKTAYDSTQIYEFLLPDKKLRRFEVTGQLE
ncbi:MAG TPA: hypothetical protein VMH04_20955 [Candidatus Solibacter sp.]|nr:hypothetical protein [Candidatus Solibacter sp.]